MNAAKTTTKPPRVDDRCTYCGDEFARHTRAEYQRAWLATVFRCDCGKCDGFVAKGRLYLLITKAGE